MDIVSYWREFMLVASVHLLAVMSPGPDFVLVVKNSLTASRRAGVWSAVGLGCGIAVQVAYSLLGIGYVISKSIVLFSVIKLVGAAYLVYIGYRALRANAPAVSSLDQPVERVEISPLAAVRQGFLTNVLNPKATLFFLSLFTQVVRPGTPVLVELVYGLEMCLATAVWFSFVAYLSSHPLIQSRMGNVQHRLEQVMGAVLIGLGLKVAASAND